MHVLLRDHLEGYLAGNLPAGDRARVDAHLAGCNACRMELGNMRGWALALRGLQPSQSLELEPAPGFYARVMQRVDREREVPFWSMLLEPSFGRRLVFACLMLLALLGSYVAAFDQADYPLAHRPEAILAGKPNPAIPMPPARLGPDLQRNRSAVLATLVADGD